MNIRQAILKAADHIEQNPAHFKYVSNDRPNPDCGTPGCMLGWIGVFLNMQPAGWSTWAGDVARAIGTTHSEFVHGFVHPMVVEHKLWVHENPNAAKNAAKLLRIYADRHHPAESRAPIPASVRAIFTMTPDQIRAEFQRDHA